MLYNILLIVQIVVSVAMIALILMQHGKGADAGAAFGSGSSGTVFGSQGSANFLSRTTAILATVFFLNSLGLAWIVAHNNPRAPSSIIDKVQQSAPETTPTAPVTSSSVPAAPAVESQTATPAVTAPATTPSGETPAAEPATATQPATPAEKPAP
ncbi:preprotein translocase subunit SecG [Thiolinea disciformis]|uniref:preprotein translocase subunit SecG n=1 Tax=Thiolinea disciformis TaxID=125614 RepID=UPI0003617749|nr:preprotein translocase subunit SecG [Thiolinea disciformis]